MKYLARVNPRYFAGVHGCAADVDCRLYLRSVHIERHPDVGVVLVATDGHTMAVIHDPSGWLHADHQSLLVQRTTKRMLSAITKPKRRDMGPEHLWVAEHCLVLSGEADTSEEPDPFGDSSICAERSSFVDGKFPDWRRILPKGEPSALPSVNIRYLARFNEISRVLSGNKHFPGDGATLVSLGEHDSVIVRLHHKELNQRFYGLIMPMRNDPLAAPVPDFVKAWPEPAQ